MIEQIDIHINNISKNFRAIRALDDVSMEFRTGTLYGIIGPAGAGKTTMLRLMLGLMKMDDGDIKYAIDGIPTKFETIRHHVAYMPQSQSLYNDLSVDEHLDFFRRLYGIENTQYRQKKQELLHLARLDKFLDRPAGNLSGGMYKKLGLICALLRSPKIMLLDEPTNGVDPISRREFWNLLHASQQQGILIIMTTAYMDEAERCGNVVLMEGGHVLANGEPSELLAQTNVQNFDEFFIGRGGVEK